LDPLTLFALANGAVSAVKAGCKLYKDIKGAAGEVKEVLKDLDDQFHKLHPPEKPATPEQKRQFQEEKQRVVELNKSDPGNAYDQIAEQLSVYFENYAKCIAIFEAEEARAQEVYEGDASVGKRALQRVVMRKKLEQMGVELRELLVYQSPPELGALYSDVSEMMEKISKEQTTAIAKKMKDDHARAIRRKKRIEKLWLEASWGVGAILIAAGIGLGLAFIVEDRIQKYPHLGDGWVPKTEEQRRLEALPKKYIGR
jgi:uncharacterized protein YajQ (UPF0234 family)